MPSEGAVIRLMVARLKLKIEIQIFMREDLKLLQSLRLLHAAAVFLFCCGLVNVVLGSTRQGIDKPDIKSVIKKISQGDIEDRLDAFDDLEELSWSDKATPAIPALQVCLSEPNASIRLKAVELLLELEQSDNRYVAIVIPALQNKDPDIRLSAAYLLYKFNTEQHHELVDSAVVALGDSEAKVRSVAASFLGNAGPDFKDKSALGLVKLLDDPNASVRKEAAVSLFHVDGPIEKAMPVLIEIIAQANDKGGNISPGGWVYDTYEAIALLGADAQATVPELNRSLESGKTYQQTAAAIALAGIKPQSESSIKLLEKALLNDNVEGMPFVHRSWCASDEAAKALVAIGEQSVPTLLSALSNKNPRVKANAAVALGSFPEAADQIIPKLIELTKDKEPSVRANAAWGLGLIGPPAKPALKPLIAMLFDDAEWESAPAGGGIANAYSVPWHAAEAIRRIEFATDGQSTKPDVNLFVDSINASLKENQSINFAAASTIAKYAGVLDDEEKAKFSTRLTPNIERLLDREKYAVEAAYALASFNPSHPRVQSTLERRLIVKRSDDSGENTDTVAARGLGILGPSARSSLPKLENAIRVCEEEGYAGNDITYCSLAILAIDPDNEKAIDGLFKGLGGSRWYWDNQAVADSLKQTPAMAQSNSYFKNQLIKRLNSVDRTPWEDPTAREIEIFNLEVRLQAARILASANLATPETTATLIKFCETANGQSLAYAQGALAKIRPTSPAAIKAITKSLSNFDVYIVGADFHGNWRISCTHSEKALEALVNIGTPALDVLLKKTDKSQFHLVRAQATKAIGLIDVPSNKSDAINKRLIELTKDPSHRVRLEAVAAISKKEITRIKMSKRKGLDPAPNDSIVSALKKASQDQRLTIRAAAEQGLSAIQSR